jgi:hypothetical protein
MLGATNGRNGPCTAVVLWQRLVERDVAARFNPARMAAPKRGHGEDQRRPKVRRAEVRATGMAHAGSRKSGLQ